MHMIGKACLRLYSAAHWIVQYILGVPPDIAVIPVKGNNVNNVNNYSSIFFLK